jgi:hypothetical protein
MLEILKEEVKVDCRPPQAIETGKIPAASNIWRTITTANRSVARFAVATMSWVLERKSILFSGFVSVCGGEGAKKYGDDHIAFLLPGVNIPVSLGCLFQRIAFINYRYYLPCFN